MPFNPARGQPLQPFFEVNVGGLNRIYHYPNVPIDMTYNVSETGYGTVEFNFFDEAAWEVEPYLWQARDDFGLAKGTFKFGYKGDLNEDSGDITFHLDGYVPVYRNNAFSINLYGTVWSTPHISNNQYTGTIKKIIDKFADDHQLEVEYDPEFGEENMQSQCTTANDTTAKMEMKYSKNQDESDWRFINRILQFAMTGDKKTGYRANLTSEKGKQKLKIFCPPGKGGSDHNYKVQDKDSVVIDWSPHVNFSNVLDAFGTHWNGYLNVTGYPAKQANELEVTKDFQGGLMGQETFQEAKPAPKHDPPSKHLDFPADDLEENSVKGNIRSRTSGMRDTHAGMTPSLSHHIQRWLEGTKADLTILGDPKLTKVFEKCHVDFYYPINYLNNSGGRKLHYTSGDYIIENIVHFIEAGNYTTTLKLMRCSQPFEPQSGGKSQ